MSFEEVSDYLSKRLQEPLPGEKAHAVMQPRLLNGKRMTIRQTEPPRRGGVLILIFEYQKQTYFPLIQRPTYDGVHSGQMALPGGKFEEGDTDLIQTAKRETWEEIGIDQHKVEVIGTLSEFFVAASNFQVLPVIGRIKEKPEFVPNPKEVGGIVTPGLRQLILPANKKEKEITVSDGIKLQSPYYDLEGKTVWGATAMMLSELATVLQDNI